MRLFIWTTLGVATLTGLTLCVPALCAPVPRTIKAYDYFPHSLNTTWVYRCGGFTFTHEITKVERHYEYTDVKISILNSYEAGICHNYYRLRSNVIYAIDPNPDSTDNDIPVCVLMMPDKWPFSGKFLIQRDPQLYEKISVSKEANVRVCAGLYDTLKVEYTAHWTRTIVWYAADVGPIKWKWYYEGDSNFGGVEPHLFELVSYTPGS